MTPSQVQELLAIGWLLLATQTRRFIRLICIVLGLSCIGFSILQALQILP